MNKKESKNQLVYNGWIARDHKELGGYICLYHQKPTRTRDFGYWIGDPIYELTKEQYKQLGFDRMIRWSDAPKHVKITITKA